MPFYEYQCAACGHHHEELQKVGDRVLRKCPACGRSSLRRLVSAPVFRLKGGGWYETDFKADQEQKRNLAGDKEHAAEMPKEEKADKAEKTEKADKTEAGPESAKAGKPAAPASAKPKAPPAKPVRARRPARRRR